MRATPVNIAIALLAHFLFASRWSRADVKYDITAIAGLGGDPAQAQLVGIDSAGTVAGIARLPDHSIHVFTFSNGQTNDLGFYGFAKSINDAGTIVGFTPLDQNTLQGFIYTNGSKQNYTAMPAPYTINNLNQIAGLASNNHVLLDTGTGVADLGHMGIFYQPLIGGINNHTQLVGSADTGKSDPTNPNYPIYDAWLYSGGTVTDLGTFGWLRSYANSINDNGDLVGTVDQGYQGRSHAFLFSGSTFHDLGTFGGTNSGATWINDEEQIVGSADEPLGGPAAFLWDKGRMVDVNTLIDPASGWNLTGAIAINDVGDIIGSGSFHGSQESFLLTPAAPEPAATSLLFLISALALLRRPRGLADQNGFRT